MSSDKRRDNVLILNEETIIYGISPIQLRDSEGVFKDVIFSLPNFTALYLNISDKHFKIAEEFYNDKLFRITIEKEKYFEIDFENEHLLFDFLESVFLSIIFAFTAVECLVNSLIPNYFIIEIQNSDNRHQFGSKGFIEKTFSLEEKLKKILPKVYGFGFNANQIKWWSKFKKMIYYRNELIHFKSNEIDDNRSLQTKFIGDLLIDMRTKDVIESAREVIKYLEKKIEDSPGFPSEFKRKHLAIEEFHRHYGPKQIKHNKKLIIKFQNEKSFKDFLTNVSQGQERKFTIDVN